MFADNLRKIRLHRGFSQSRLADALGKSKSTISMWENGSREPDFETLELIADILNVSMDSLIGKKTDLSVDFLSKYGLEPLPKFKKIPLLGSIACGEPLLAEENLDGFVNCAESVSADFALTCHGDSMINARIFDGDIVFIRQQADVDDGDIAAVLIDDSATLKKVRRFPGHLVLSPCNPLYSEMIYSGEQLNEIRILGKAVAFLSAVRK